jgi:hypothetical protein
MMMRDEGDVCRCGPGAAGLAAEANEAADRRARTLADPDVSFRS